MHSIQVERGFPDDRIIGNGYVNMFRNILADERGKILQGKKYPRKEPYVPFDDHYRVYCRYYFQIDESRLYVRNFGQMVCAFHLLLKPFYGIAGFNSLLPQCTLDAQIRTAKKSTLLRQALFTSFCPFDIMAKIMKKEILSYDLQYNFGRFGQHTDD